MNWNNAILCVDDETGILESYSTALANQSENSAQLKEMVSRRQLRKKDMNGTKKKEEESGVTYEIFTASSGEEALAIVRDELHRGRQFAAGFFDMIMPGGIDGMETIKQIRQMDQQILCAVATAYTDRSPEQIGKLFSSRDDWLYFNKPFTTGELTQTAHHLVTSWNKRRREEALFTNMRMMKNGLLTILESLKDINQFPPLVFTSLLYGILHHYLGLVEATDGFIVIQSGHRTPYQVGSGKFNGYSDLSAADFQAQWSLSQQAINKKKSILQGTMAAVPLAKGNEVIGVLFVEKNQAIVQDLMLLDIFANQAVGMIEQSQLYEELEIQNVELSKKNQELMKLFKVLSNTITPEDEAEKTNYVDQLTGIPNRGSFEIRFKEEIDRCRRHSLSLACLMLDIDHFENVNDDYGREAGDYILHELARLLYEKKRPYNLVARYGGEEFAVILKHTNRDKSEYAAENLRKAVEEHTFFFNGNLIKITVSIGLVITKPEKDTILESLVDAAFNALKKAKKEGCNRCIFSET